MTIRKLLASTAAITLATLAFAGSATADTVWHWKGGEVGYQFTPEHAKSNKTRAEVQAETKLARDFGAGKVSPDGWRYVGGERGWVNEGHKIEYRDGKWVHVDGIDKTTAKPSPKMTPKEEAEYKKLYFGG